ncbi:uncharacterized protein LOC123470434 [Daphnia magna]|uniref:uncharacterized protein LOC123470434 n=1 Tax=Daphnia magna TaxID=35525 RepID=UPI001E1BA695|nr:uncharacterized protein LOC123470434 [Daphnia magna]
MDVTVFGPFKKSLSAFHHSWLKRHSGQRISIKEVAELTRPAFQQKMSPSNIIAGFKSTGIYPFNRYAIDQSRFAPSLVTDLAVPSAELPDSVATDNSSVTSDNSSLDHITPEQIQPFPMVKQTGMRKKKACNVGSTRILTSTPEKQIIEDHHNCIQAKKKGLAIPTTNKPRKVKSKGNQDICIDDENKENYCVKVTRKKNCEKGDKCDDDLSIKNSSALSVVNRTRYERAAKRNLFS